MLLSSAAGDRRRGHKWKAAGTNKATLADPSKAMTGNREQH